MFDRWVGFCLAMAIMDTALVPYNVVRRKIRDGDLLLFRPRGLWTRLIPVAGRSVYAHAAMAGWWEDRLMCVEMTQGGGRAQLLSNLVEQWPGVIDLLPIQTPIPRRFSRARALEAMLEITGQRYGWGNLVRAAFLHLPVFRFLVSPEMEDGANGTPPFCSQALATAYRAGGRDPVPNLADRLTEPGDLARSAFFDVSRKVTLIVERATEPAEAATEVEV